MGRIDVHCHLLPGVDDGCPTVEESLNCARMMVQAGYTQCFCTPHVWPNLPNQTRTALTAWVAQLQQSLNQANIPLKLFPGGELNLQPKVMETPDEQIISYGLWGRHILVDMWADRLPDWFEPTIRWLQDKSLTVILAHPERMRAIQDYPELADQLADMGILLQGNLQCFADRPDADTRITAERYLRENRYFMLGSDTHNVEGLKHRLKGLQIATDLAGPAKIDELMRLNPQKLFPST